MKSVTQISVVMAFHRTDDFLDEAIASVLKNTERDIELILVSDRVPERSVIGLKARNFDDRLVFLESKSEGAGEARNLGFARASGKYIAIMDSDDLSFPSRLEVQAKYLDNHKDVVAVGSQVQYICPHGIGLGRSRYPARLRRGFLSKPFDSMVSNPTAMIRKEALLKIGGGYRGQFSTTVEDLDMWNRLLRIGDIVNLKEVLLKYRTHPQQNSKQNTSEILVLKRLCQLFEIYESFGDGRHNLEEGQIISVEDFKRLVHVDARQSLSWRGKIRLSWYLQGIRGEQGIEEERSRTKTRSFVDDRKLPFNSRLSLLIHFPIPLLVLAFQNKTLTSADFPQKSSLDCLSCKLGDT
jgi:glycosyltransferase involved in cell wall biosynthesis